MKICRKCNQEKPITEYYKHPQMADGHLNHCKECVKEYERSHQKTEQSKAIQRLWWQSEKGRAKQERMRKRYRATHRERYKAHSAVNLALRSGRLTKQPCAVCGNLKVEAHHDDYTRPLKVTWLCFTHHRQLHQQQVAG